MLAATIASCGFGEIEPNTRIDGWSVGTPIACDAPVPHCDILIPLAIQGFDERDPGHPPIVNATVRDEGLYPNKRGDLVEVVRSSSGVWVVLLQLADGTYRAIGAGNVLGDPMVFGEGPQRAP